VLDWKSTLSCNRRASGHAYIFWITVTIRIAERDISAVPFRGQRATGGHLSWHPRFTSALTVETVKGIIKFSISCRANFEVNTCLSSASYWLITDNMQPTKRAISEFRFTSEPEKAYATQPLAVFCCIWGDESIRSKPYAVSMLMINDNGLGPSECLNEPGCAIEWGPSWAHLEAHYSFNAIELASAIQ
jgi:hypothetical protein